MNMATLLRTQCFIHFKSCRFPLLCRSRVFHPKFVSTQGPRRRFMSSLEVVEVKEKIHLTPKEQKIFNLLLDVTRHFSLEVQLRVAGGWVRDKLMGNECSDIDIALSNMLGRQFCEKVKEYMRSCGEEQEDFAVIQCNPDQSKHLEAAKMRIFGTWVDFVNLRSENYSEDSRIPTMEFGTAKEDAYRRDLTINSLFYNINTDSVEDLTARGISDLKCGRIMTPLHPKSTFLDDPLRVLRAIRFGARFSFTLDEELKRAASDKEVLVAIANKISRERIGHEIELMISGHHPNKAMGSICNLQLFWVVFATPQGLEPPITEECERLCVAFMCAAWDVIQRLDCPTIDAEHRRLCLYGALFLPLRRTMYAEYKGKKMPVTNHIFRNSLKHKVSDAVAVAGLHNSLESFVTLIHAMASEEDFDILDNDLDESVCVSSYSKRRIFAGLLLQHIKDLWRVALLLATLVHNVGDHVEEFQCGAFEVVQCVEEFRRTELSVLELGLERVWEMMPVLDGCAVMTELQLKPGKQVGDWKSRVLKWQLAHPAGTADECLDWIRESHAKYAKLN